MRRWRELPIAGYGTTKVGPINHLRSGMLSYVTPEWVHAMRPVGVITDPPIILCSQECRDIVADRGGIPSNSSDPAGEFWAAVNSAVPGSLWGPESDNKIAASAVVHPYAHVGVPAFKVFRSKLCPSFGGVVIGEHSSIGANTCIARGIFGEYTEIGDNVHIDNLVHVGHSAIIGNGTTIAANSTIGGWAEIGEGCRIETGVTVFQSVKIGAGSRIGSGSVVTHDVPSGVVAYGNPCRVVREVA